MRQYNKDIIRNYIVEKTKKFIKRLCKKISKRYDSFYANEADVVRDIKEYMDTKTYKEEDHNIKEIKASEIGDAQTMVVAAVCRSVDVKIDADELLKAEWIDVENKLPDEEGFYVILTDYYLVKGIAFYGSGGDSNDEKKFEVWWAMTGSPGGAGPQVKYWLKDHHWGMVYDYKKKKGEI